MAYIGTSPSNGVRRIHTYTATAGQTTFTGSSTEGVTLTYADTNYIDVFQNGVLLGSADYTSTSGTSVVLAQGASVSDLVVIVVYDVFSVADTVSKTSGGSFDSGVTMSSTLGVTGASTLTGALSAKGGVVFNEDSADVDFRVESNGNANMIFVEGSTDRVGIGTATLANKLEVDGGSAETRLRISSTGTDLREAGIILANSSKSSDNDGIVISHGGAATTFDDLGGNELMRLGQSSNRARLAIGTSSPDGLVTISGDENPIIRINHTQNADEIIMILQHAGAIASGYTTMIQLRDHDGDERGTIKTNGSGTQFNTSSDYRLKENVSYNFDATTRLKQLKPCRFNFKIDADKTVDGFLAHEVSSIVPDAISGEKDAMTKEVLYVDGDEIPDGKKVGDVKEASKIAPQGIDHSKLVPLLVKTIQELEARITALENK